ncbi:MAG: FAD-binding protein [Myxococcota bacterium]|nr:FAD-binding protein [Myxococcota bacterium]
MPRAHPAIPDEIELDLGLDEPDDPASLRARVSRMLRVPPEALPDIALRKRSIDARRGRVSFHVVLGLRPDSERLALGEPSPREVKGEPRVVIVGDGPCGLFAAYQLAREGIASVVLDRGKPVQPRRHDLKGLQKEGRIDPDSNYCFGEGGAGTYSDGKLYTRAHKRGPVRDVIELLALHGAPPSILVDARPHIGSNKLPQVVTAMREHLEQCGVRFEFGARVVDLLIDEHGTSGGSASRRVKGLRLADGREIGADMIVLATGHSARDVFELLLRARVTLEPKAFALGVRIEHPQPLIDRIQYGDAATHPKLPAASYRLAETVDERGVFSFCMCPGGWIVPASTEPDGLVVNGMSLSRRDSPYANSGLVVAVEVDDWARAGFSGPLGGIELQRTIERAAMQAGDASTSPGMLRAPATRATDFVARRGSSTVPASSYIPGLTATNVADVLDVTGIRFSRRLEGALRAFDRRMRGYLTEESVLVGVESRTSAPVRVPRDPGTLESLDVAGLYPAGEGAGYAGGIVSAALDGVRVARAIAGAMQARQSATTQAR